MRYNILIIACVIIVSVFIGKAVTQFSPLLIIGAVSSVIVGFITLVNTNIALIILIFSMLLSPEIPIAHVPERAVVVRIDDILIMVVFFTWLAKMAVNKELGLLKKTPLNKPIISYILVCILFTAKGILIGEVMFTKAFFYILKYIEYAFLYFIFANNITDKKNVKQFVGILLLTAFIVGSYGYFQIAQGVSRISAPFEGEHLEPNTLGGYLVLIQGITLGLFLYASSKKLKLLLGLFAVFLIPPFLFTLSRSAYIAFIPMYIMLILLTKRNKALLISLAILGIVLLPTILPKEVIDRVMYTFTGRHTFEAAGMRFGLETSAAARIWHFRSTLIKWRQSPIFGHGITGIGFIDGQYPLVLGELGLVGLGIFLWLLSKVFKTGYRTFRLSSDEFSKGLSLGFIAGFCGLLVQALTANIFIIVRIMEPFWLLAATVTVLLQIAGKPETA